MPDLSQTSPTAFSALPRLMPLPTQTGQVSEIFPIEWFRDRSHAYFVGEEVSREFRSSGTTDAQRARSLFSAKGLQSYREQALSEFAALLKTRFHWNLHETVGLSLIPNADEWPDSSLAQMLTWLAEVVPVQFVTAAELVAAAGQTKTPFWIFGTAFHWVNAIDDGRGFRLPGHAIVIETGGTKGRSRSISPDDLRRELRQAFGVPAERIVSEYGMGELACQAYDYLTSGQRHFRFADAVQLSVLTDEGIVAKEGDGLLVVKDPGRVDYPWPIRTQDLVRLYADGSFSLHGRYRYAPLKGCSLQVEELIGATGTMPSLSPQNQTPFAANKGRNLATRLRNFLQSPSWLTAAKEEFPEGELADLLTVDLLAAIPSTDAEFANSVERSTLPPESSWVFIAPNNHGIALFEALILATVAACEVCVRLPRDHKPTLQAWLNFLSGEKAKITTRSADWRIDASTLLPAQSLLVFGSTETVSSLQDIYPGRVAGHGHVIGVASSDGERGDGEAIVRDAFSLAQRGCLSTRLCIVSATNFKSFLNDCMAQADSLLGAVNRLSILLNGHFEHARTFPLGEIHTSKRGATFLVINDDSDQVGCVEQFASRHPFVLTIVVTKHPTSTSFVKIAEQCKTATILLSSCKGDDLRETMVQNGYRNCAFLPLGMIHRQKWNGFHLTTPIFKTR